MKRRWLAMMLAITMAASLIPTGGGLGYVAEAAELPEAAETAEPEETGTAPAQSETAEEEKTSEAGEVLEETPETAPEEGAESAAAEEETREDLPASGSELSWEALGIDLEEEYIYVGDCGEDYTLEVGETDQVEVTYTWYREVLDPSYMEWSYELMPGENSHSLTVRGKLQTMWYRCVLEAEGLGRAEKIFRVGSDCRLSVAGPGSVMEGDPVCLKAQLEDDCGYWDRDEFTYRWYRQVKTGTDEEGYNYYRWEEIPGDGGYQCEFTADAESSVWYILTASYGGEVYGQYYTNVNVCTFTITGIERLQVAAGETGTLRVFAFAPGGASELTYQWAKWNMYEREYVAIDGAVASSYTPPAASLEKGDNEYCCTVSDGIYTDKLYCDLIVDRSSSEAGMRLEYDPNAIAGESTELRAILPDGVQVRECTWYLDEEKQVGENDLVLCVPAEFTYGKSSFEMACRVIDVNGIEHEVIGRLQLDSSLVLSYDSEVYVPYGQDAVLSVAANSIIDGETTYAWYLCEGDEDEYSEPEDMIYVTDEATCSVSWDSIRDGSRSYRCIIRDGSSEKTARITIYPRLTSEGEKFSFESEGAQVTLRADACTGAEETTYQWAILRGEDYEDIEGANEAAWPVTAHYQGEEEYQSYRCRITCGGIVDYVFYDIATEGTLVVVEGERRWGPDEEGLLSVAAHTGTGNPITYRWLRYDYQEGIYEEIPGADQPALRLTDGEMANWTSDYQRYICRISDGVNTLECSMYATRLALIEIDSKYRDLTMCREDTAVLSVADAVCRKGTLSYQWQQYISGSGYEDIPGANGAELIIDSQYFDPEEEEYDFRCLLSVGQYEATVYFEVSLDDFWARPVEEDIEVAQGEPVELKVAAGAAGGRQLHYVWFRETACYSGNWQEIPGADSSTYYPDPATLQRTNRFECYVTDGISERKIQFYVYLTDPSTITDDDRSLYTQLPGKSCLVVCQAVSAPGCGALRYQWYRMDGEEEILIPGATGAEYTAPAEELSAGRNEYRCVVSNDIDTRDCCYNVCVMGTSQTLTEGQPCWGYSREYSGPSWFTFIPSSDGVYEFLSDEPWNAILIYVDNDAPDGLEPLESRTDDWDWYTNVGGYYVNERVELKAGQTCYLYCYMDGHSIRILAREAQKEIRPQQNITGWLNEDVILTVPEDCQGTGYTYQWSLSVGPNYDETEYYPITGANGPSYRVKSTMDKDHCKNLLCVVNTGSREIWLTYPVEFTSVRPADDILAYWDEKAPGSAIDITAAADSMYADADITYKWFESYEYNGKQDEYVRIPGADSARYQGIMPETLDYVSSYGYEGVGDAYILRCLIDDGHSTAWVSYIFGMAEGEPEPHVHAWSGYTVTKEATCTAAGTRVRTCYCGETETVTIPALGHNYANHQCSRCGEWELSTPRLSTITNPVNAVQITWQAVDGAAKYRVYRKTATTGWAKLADTAATSYKDTTGVTGTTYIYTVRAFASDGLLGSNFDKTGLSCTYQCTPILSKVENVVGGVKVTWQAATGAPKYRVFRKAAGETSWTKVGDTTAATLTDTKAVSGTTYYYTVRVLFADSKSYLSTFNSTGLSVLCLKDLKPTLTNAATGITVKWSRVTGAKGYYVYRKTGTGSYARIATITDGSTVAYTDTAVNANSGTTYTYAVRAYNGTTAGAYTGASILRLANIKPTLANASTGITVKWTKVAGAAGYYVYRKSGSSNYARIATVTNGSTVSYTDTTSTLVNGTAYTYAVKAYNGTTTGSYTGVATYRLKGVAISSLTNAATLSMIVKWAADTKVTGYQVQYSTTSDFSSGNKTVTIAKNSTVSTTIKSLTKGKTYYVRIRAYKQNSAGTNYFSGWSAKKYVKIAK